MATSDIKAEFNSSGNLKVTGVGSAKIRLGLSWGDNPNTFGDAIDKVEVNGMTFKSPGENGNDSQVAVFTPGTYAVTYSGLIQPITVNKSSVKMRDNDGNDANATFSIESIINLEYSDGGGGDPPPPDPPPDPPPPPPPVPGCTDPRANNYNPAAEINDGSCTYSPPTVSISLSRSWIVNTGNQSVTLSWSSGGVINSVSVTDVSNPGTGGSKSVSPSSSTTYTITATGPGGSASQSVTLTVYQPPTITLSLGNNPIISGGSTTLSWTVSGNTTTTTVDQGIGSVPNNGSTTIFPLVSTTYTATTIFVDPAGGTYSDSDNIRLIVYQPPTLEITLPAEVNYTENIKLEYEYQYANISAKVTPQYRYRNANNDGLISVFGTSVNLTPLSTSAEFGIPGTLVSGQVTLSPIYNDDGPFSIGYLVEVEGNGGKETINQTVNINIDLSPDNINIPDSEGNPNQEPIYTPDPGIFPNTELIIQDVDIPVEIKCDKPIKVSLDDGNTWLNVREKK